ncbi:hypothetical protein NXC14_PA00299 (plasmid) [Rhizobium sp. NXC14]|nr:hypothetical protein NXC14_PA00299 [Rhizobium sp. NXC14]
MERQIFLSDTSCMTASAHPASFSHADCQVTASAVVTEYVPRRVIAMDLSLTSVD